MKYTFFFFLLSFLRSSGWCRALGSACPEETCTLANRESCSLGSIQCGSCLQGFFEVEGACLPIESSPNDDDTWETELEGTDGSDLNVLFDATQAPSTAKQTEKQHNSPDSSPDSIDFTTPSAPATAVEENSNNLHNKNYDLEGKVATKDAESSEHGTEHDSKKNGAKKIQSSNDFKSKSKELKNKEDANRKRKLLLKKQDKNLQKKNKEMDEEKLNKFLSKKDSSDKVMSSEDGVNLEGNSSSNPPPFIRKHKIGKGEEPKASEMDDIYFLFIVIGCSVAGIAGLGLAGYCWYKLHTTAKAVSESEYTGYGMKGSTKRPPSLHGDDKLDYNAEMYHYHQTKSQLAAMEKAGSKSSKQGSMEDDENSDEGDEGDYTVYECPGLAPTGDMTVVNPLFSDQEAVGSDQDANGNRSGHSSPTSSRHSTTTKPAE